MFNPFKKKKVEDNSYKLDEYSLPSISDQNKNSYEQTSQQGLSSTGTDAFNPTIPEHRDSYDSYGSTTFQSGSAMAPSSFESKQAYGNSSNSSNDEISRTKIEALEAKVSLIDAKLSTIDQKLEVIYQMLAAEISEDTRRRLNVQSMVENAKRKQ